MDMFAGQLGIDRGEIRRINYIPPERFPFQTATGLRYDSGDYRTALDLALERIGYDGFGAGAASRRRGGAHDRARLRFLRGVDGDQLGDLRMRGMRNVRGYDAGRVALNDDGTFSVWTSCPAIGQGVATTFAQIVAEHLTCRSSSCTPSSSTPPRRPAAAAASPAGARSAPAVH